MNGVNHSYIHPFNQSRKLPGSKVIIRLIANLCTQLYPDASTELEAIDLHRAALYKSIQLRLKNDIACADDIELFYLLGFAYDYLNEEEFKSYTSAGVPTPSTDNSPDAPGFSLSPENPSSPLSSPAEGFNKNDDNLNPGEDK